MAKILPLSHKRKQPIPKAVREQLWIRDMGKRFEGKCRTSWCKNIVTVYDFQCGHNIPESKGGPTVLENLIVLCSRCNLSMSDTYTFTEWTKQHNSTKRSFWKKFFSCF